MSMNLYHSNNIGNVAVLGHLGSGKTSVIEAMAKRAGISQQIFSLYSSTEKFENSNGFIRITCGKLFYLLETDIIYILLVYQFKRIRTTQKKKETRANFYQ